jgi:hypothetical protein
MKKKIIKITVIALFLSVLQSVSFSQSDYEVVQKFKNEYQEILQKINDARSVDNLIAINPDIKKWISSYSANADLFDKALYPDTYHDMMSSLTEYIAMREEEFNENEEFQGELTELKQRVDTLTIRNTELQASLQEIKLLFEKSQRESSRLRNTVAELKIALQKRDRLVINMVDSLMPPVMREKAILSAEDKEQIAADIDRNNIISNVKNTIRDNIKYLKMTSMQPEDLSDIQAQQDDFVDTWSRIGTRLAEVYSEDEHRSDDLLEIDSLFSDWTLAIEHEAWQSIKEEFDAKGLVLNEFSDREEFVNSINSYINAEKQNIQAVTETEARSTFEEFTDQTWKAGIESKWTPFLLENGMLVEEDMQAIENNIEVWRSEIYPSNWWLWVIFIGLLLSGLVLLLRVLKNNTQFDNVTDG